MQDGTRRYCDHYNCYRMGLTANRPGSALMLTVDTSSAVQRVAQQPNSYPAAALNKVQLAVLFTQAPRGKLGVARLSCVANCVCGEIEMDGIAADGDGSAALAAGRTEVSWAVFAGAATAAAAAAAAARALYKYSGDLWLMLRACMQM